MKVGHRNYRSIWLAEDGASVEIIDQTKLPHAFVTAKLRTLEDAATAIRDMQVRGAPLIGVTAAYGLCLALRRDASDAALARAATTLEATRPTAVNLAAALARMRTALEPRAPSDRSVAAYALAAELADEDVAQNRAIGEHGLALIREIARTKPHDAVRIMTHCNAGWLATVDVGTALAPVYAAHDAGVPVHVWVSETRPRSQGSFLTAWELASHGVPHAVIVDNAAGHLMQRGDVDAVIVGADRVTRQGDVANKIGTYLKALAARASTIPFYVAVPSSSIDWNMQRGAEIPIEERSPAEVTHLAGVQVVPAGSAARNPAFDVTPSSLVTALVTERGICDASESGLAALSRTALNICDGRQKSLAHATENDGRGIRKGTKSQHRRKRNMDELRTPTVELAADVVLSDGRQFPGRLFVPASAPRHAGPTRASEWLNEPAEFFAFLPDDSREPIMVNKGEVLFVTVPAEANGGGSTEDLDTPRPAVEVECAGHRLEGHLAIDMPVGQTRVLDYLNRSERFLTLRDGRRHYLLRKSGIIRVFDKG